MQINLWDGILRKDYCDGLEDVNTSSYYLCHRRTVSSRSQYKLIRTKCLSIQMA